MINTMSIKNIVFSGVLVLSMVSAEVLTWPDCLAITSVNNRTLLIAQEKLVQQDAGLAIARSGFWPQVGVGANTRHSESTVQDPQATNKSDSVGYDFSVRQNIFDGFKTWDSALASEQELQAAQYAYFITASEVRLVLRNAFIALLKAQEQKKLSDIIVERRAQNMALLKLKYDGGREHKGALLLARADLDQAEADVVQAERAIILAQQNLWVVIGRPIAEIVVSENKLVEPPVNPNFLAIAEGNPQLRQLEAKFNAAKHSAVAVRADQLPQVYASYQNGNSGATWPPENSQWSLGANLSFTVFDGNSNGAAQKKSESLITQAAIQSADGKQTIVLTLAQAWTEFADARDAVKVRRSFLVAAEERAKISSAQYAAGLMTFDNWSIIEDNLVNAQKSYVNAKAAILQAEARWAQACGGGFDEN